MGVKVNIGSVWKDSTPSKIKVGGVWVPVQTVKANVGGVWRQVYPPVTPSEQPYLYDVVITYQGNHVVDFTALSGYVHIDGEEAYMFRCAELPSLNGYVTKNFTKTFPVTAYAKFNCTLEDVSGDITDPTLRKTISFYVDNR